MRFRPIVAITLPLLASHASAAYSPTILVANDPSYHPTVMVDPLLQNAWGIAIRPPGAGGHFWLSNFASGTTTTYLGDVNGQPLSQDSLKVVNIAVGSGVRVNGLPTAAVPMPTGQVYNYSTTDFVVSGEGITAASKFIFVTAEGTISGWTELPDPLPGDPNHKLRQITSVIKVDQSQQYDDDRLRYTGVAITDYTHDNRLFVTNYITSEMEVYDKEFHRVQTPGTFRYPGQPSDYHPWNTQYFHTGAAGEGRVWVAYAEGDDPWEQDPSHGAVAEFDTDGNFLRKLTLASDIDGTANGELRVPWGMAIAPADFGPLSSALLVANFGDGTIAGFDTATGHFIDFLRDAAGDPLQLDGIWGLTFGNGVALGDSNALYYTAGPNNEQDGVFGVIRYSGPVSAVPEPASIALVSFPTLLLLRRRRKA